MDFEEDDGENGGRQQRVKLPGRECIGCPGDKFGHSSSRFEWRRRFEYDADLFSCLVERCDVGGLRLVIAAMAGILFAVFEQVAMQLPDVVFGKCDVSPGLED